MRKWLSQKVMSTLRIKGFNPVRNRIKFKIKKGYQKSYRIPFYGLKLYILKKVFVFI